MREKYESLALVQLKELAKVRGLKGTSTMKKADLVEAMLAEDERLKKEEEAKAAEIKLPHKKKRPAPSYPSQERKIVPQQVTTQAKVQPVANMTPEEVKAARENAYNQYKVQKETKITPILNEEDRQFDTSKLDISKIVGFNHELEKEFKMVEKLDNTSKNDFKGGDRE